ncbi:hypothetical protein XANCAGTX0491_006328 [Xanthoria calcicola]
MYDFGFARYHVFWAIRRVHGVCEMMRPQGGLVDMMSLSRFCLGRFKGLFLLYVLGVFQPGGKQLSTSFRSPLMPPPMLKNVLTRQMYGTSRVQAAIVFAHA